MEVDRASLLLSAQRALLGSIGPGVRAVSVKTSGNKIELCVFTDAQLSDDEREALEVAGTEVLADFPGAVSEGVRFVQRPEGRVKSCGIWVFVRYGCEVS